jgi:hypothetical protein
VGAFEQAKGEEILVVESAQREQAGEEALTAAVVPTRRQAFGELVLGDRFFVALEEDEGEGGLVDGVGVVGVDLRCLREFFEGGLELAGFGETGARAGEVLGQGEGGAVAAEDEFELGVDEGGNLVELVLAALVMDDDAEEGLAFAGEMRVGAVAVRQRRVSRGDEFGELVGAVGGEGGAIEVAVGFVESVEVDLDAIGVIRVAAEAKGGVVVGFGVGDLAGVEEAVGEEAMGEGEVVLCAGASEGRGYRSGGW